MVDTLNSQALQPLLANRRAQMYREVPRPSLYILAIVALVFPALMLLGNTKPVQASICIDQRTFAQKLQESNAVFAGEVVHIEQLTRLEAIVFKVSGVWKGPVQELMTVTNPMTSAGYDFEVGRGYIVYTDNSFSSFHTGLCDVTPLSDHGPLPFSWALGESEPPAKLFKTPPNGSESAGLAALLVISTIAVMATIAGGAVILKRLKPRNGATNS